MERQASLQKRLFGNGVICLEVAVGKITECAGRSLIAADCDDVLPANHAHCVISGDQCVLDGKW